MQALLDRMGYVPRTCVWEITRACNLRCGHCGSMAGTQRRDELSTNECRRVIEELAALGNQLITFSGGEPTLRCDWPELAKFARAQGITVNLVTNGQTSAAELATAARSAGLSNVAVSLDGLESTHDALRGPSTFRHATAVIQSLCQAGIWVDVMVTLNRKNLQELEQLHSYVASLGVRRFRVQLGKPMGHQTHRHDLTLAPRQLLQLMPVLGQLHDRRRLPIMLGDSIGYFSNEERRLRSKYCDQEHWTGCYAGCQAIGIQSDGSIKGCLSLQPRAGEADPFIEGNVRQESLHDIWFGPGRFGYNRAPQQELAGACGTCSHRSLCRGGAKCVAYAFTGSLGHDPMCYLAASRTAARAAERIWPSAAAVLLLGMATPGCGGESTSGSSGTGGTAGAAGNPSVGGASNTGGSIVTAGQAATGGATSAATGGTTTAPAQGGSAAGGAVTGGQGQGGSATGGKAATGGAASTTTAGNTATGGAASTTTAGNTATGGAASTTTAGHAATGGATSATPGGQTAAGGTAQGGTTQTGTSTLNCQSVCCMCDYGIISPELYAACCSSA